MDIVMFLENFHFRNEVLELIVPAVMMAVDFVTGTFGAWMMHTFKSAKMRSGLTKKVGEMSILIVGALLSYAMSLPPQLMAGISLYIIYMELMSICENAKKMGAPLPGFVSKVLNTVDATLKEEDITEASMCILRPLFLGNGELATVVGHYNDQNSDETYNGSFTAWELKPMFTRA